MIWNYLIPALDGLIFKVLSSKVPSELAKDEWTCWNIWCLGADLWIVSEKLSVRERISACPLAEPVRWLQVGSYLLVSTAMDNHTTSVGIKLWGQMIIYGHWIRKMLSLFDKARYAVCKAVVYHVGMALKKEMSATKCRIDTPEMD